MNDFILRLRAAWNYLRYVPYIPEADTEDAWANEDQSVYSAFAKTPTGQKLAMRSRNLMNRSAVRANHAAHNLAYASGWSCGIAATFSWLDGHLKPEDEPKDQENEEANDPFERLRP